MPTAPPVATASDSLIAVAKTLPELIAAAKASDPILAAALLGRATSAAMTQFGAIAVGAVTLLASRYGLGWSDDTDEIVAGVLTLGAGLLFHWLQVRLHLAALQAPAAPATNASASVS